MTDHRFGDSEWHVEREIKDQGDEGEFRAKDRYSKVPQP
jgi:hypothetical protein